MDAEDAEQTAVIGLLMAAKKFKPELGYQFSTYATHCIRRACQRLGPEFALAIRIPPSVFWPCFRIQRQLASMAARQVSKHALEEILTQIESDEVLSKNWPAFLRATSIQSLSQTTTLIDPILAPVECIVQSEIGTTIRNAIDKLPRRNALIIRLRYGIDGPSHTLEAIGNRLGITRERVRQIQSRAEELLQSILKSKRPSESPNSRELPKKG
ncbi:MAG TPA: sigma-70 family RNA polymerase sigma factor [Gemmataceae bacterium]|nr:sigma-70 family RNA polymerase sigma factor [Gemmataceae bacterium]